MTEPQFEFSATPKSDVGGPKPFLGWLALALMLTLLIVQQFSAYIQRSDDPLDTVLSVDSQLRMSFRLREASSRFSKASEPQYNEQISQITSELNELRKTDGFAAMVFSAAQFEMGKRPEPSDLAVMSKGTPRQKAAAKIYRSEAIKAGELTELIQPFTGATFTDQLIKTHAREKAGDELARSQLYTPYWMIYVVLAVGIVVCAGLAGIIFLITYVAKRNAGEWTPVGHPAGDISAALADGNAFRVVLILASLFGCQMFFGYLRFIPDGPHITVFVFAIAIVIALALLKVVMNGETFSAASAGLKSNHVVKDILWGFAAAMANIPILIVAFVVGQALFFWLPPAKHPVRFEMMAENTFFGFAMILISAAIGAPILEELTFRGTLLPALIQRFKKPAIGVVWCGFLFAAIHPTGLPAWPALAAIGMMGAAITIQRGSLIPAIAMHAIHNFSLLVISKIFMS